MSDSFGQRIRALRKARGLTLAEAANAAGMSVAMLSRIERGERNASPDAVSRLAGFFGVPEEELLADAVQQQVRERWGDEGVDSLRRRRGEHFHVYDAYDQPVAKLSGLPSPDVSAGIARANSIVPSDLTSHVEGLAPDAELRHEQERHEQERRQQGAKRSASAAESSAPRMLPASRRRAYRERPIGDLLGPEEPATDARWLEQAQRGAESALFMATHNWIGRAQRLEPEARMEALEHFAALATQPLRALEQAAERDPDSSVRETAARLLAEVRTRIPRSPEPGVGSNE